METQPHNLTEIEEIFFQIFKYMGIPKEQIKMDASFEKDFDFGDFQFTCLAFYIGVYFKINVREEDYTRINTVRDAIDFVRKKLGVC